MVRRKEAESAELVSRLAAVAELGRRLTECADEAGVLLCLRAHIGAVLGVDASGILLDSNSGDTFQAYPLVETDLAGWGERFPATGRMARVVMQQAEARSWNNLSDIELPSVHRLVEMGLHSLLFVPIAAAGVRLGTFLIASRRSRIDRELDRTLAHHLAATIGAALMAARSRRKLAESRSLAEQAVAQREAFLGVMAHELRTPLHAIVATGQVLSLSEVPAHLVEPVRTICTSGETLSALVDDVLDFSKNRGGGLKLQVEPFDLRHLLGDVVEVARRRHVRDGARVRFSVDFGLDETVFCSDPVRTWQVMLNLVSNAAKFTDEGAVVVRVRPSEVVCGVRIEVIDNGRGIPEDAIPGLFLPFSQVETGLARRHGGTGLGLTICKQIVEASGGHIEVRSEVGHGSTFVVHLPGERLGSAEDLASTPLASLASLPPVERAVRVLLLDDNPVNLAVGKALLQRLGVVVHTVGGAREALSAYRSDAFDLVLMDLHMPEVDGLQATRWLLEGPGPHAVVVALTADTARDVHADCSEAGMVSVLTKPTRLEQLQACLAKVVPRTPHRSARFRKVRRGAS